MVNRRIGTLMSLWILDGAAPDPYIPLMPAHRQLLKEVWGMNSINQAHYVRVYVGQLRQKLEGDPARPRVLLTEPGVGYRFKAE
jgi:hypothetical protein